jgi:hypothetical protein
VWTFVIALVLAAAALAYNFSEDNKTRDRVRVVERETVDPCKRPRSDSCQRRIALVLRELVKRHPKVLKELGLRPRPTKRGGSPSFDTTPVPGGGGSDNPPKGGGPIGRVPPRRPNPPEPPSPPVTSPPAPDPPGGVGVKVPVPVQVCGVVVRVNC